MKIFVYLMGGGEAKKKTRDEPFVELSSVFKP